MPPFADAQTVKQLKVRNADGDMVPLGAVANVDESAGPVQLTRYNMFPAAAISGASLPGISTGDVLSTMERLAEQELPPSMTYEWTELSYLQKLSSQIQSFRDLQQNPFARSHWEWCWSSSCWPACTRAGRCLWR